MQERGRTPFLHDAAHSKPEIFVDYLPRTPVRAGSLRAMPSARIVYPALLVLAIVAFVAGLATEGPVFFVLGAACECAAFAAFLARERAKAPRR